eukprot:g536.t1
MSRLFAAGDRVEVYFRRRKQWLAGTIQSVTDGDDLDNVEDDEAEVLFDDVSLEGRWIVYGDRGSRWRYEVNKSSARSRFKERVSAAPPKAREAEDIERISIREKEKQDQHDEDEILPPGIKLIMEDPVAECPKILQKKVKAEKDVTEKKSKLKHITNLLDKKHKILVQLENDGKDEEAEIAEDEIFELEHERDRLSEELVRHENNVNLVNQERQEHFRNFNNAVIKIQGAQRRRIHRTSTHDIQRIMLDSMQAMQAVKENGALVIQKHYRGHQGRRLLEKDPRFKRCRYGCGFRGRIEVVTKHEEESKQKNMRCLHVALKKGKGVALGSPVHVKNVLKRLNSFEERSARRRKESRMEEERMKKVLASKLDQFKDLRVQTKIEKSSNVKKVRRSSESFRGRVRTPERLFSNGEGRRSSESFRGRVRTPERLFSNGEGRRSSESFRGRVRTPERLFSNGEGRRSSESFRGRVRTPERLFSNGEGRRSSESFRGRVRTPERLFSNGEGRRSSESFTEEKGEASSVSSTDSGSEFYMEDDDDEDEKREEEKIPKILLPTQEKDKLFTIVSNTDENNRTKLEKLFSSDPRVEEAIEWLQDGGTMNQKEEEITILDDMDEIKNVAFSILRENESRKPFSPKMSNIPKETKPPWRSDLHYLNAEELYSTLDYSEKDESRNNSYRLINHNDASKQAPLQNRTPEVNELLHFSGEMLELSHSFL